MQAPLISSLAGIPSYYDSQALLLLPHLPFDPFLVWLSLDYVLVDA